MPPLCHDFTWQMWHLHALQYLSHRNLVQRYDGGDLRCPILALSGTIWHHFVHIGTVSRQHGIPIIWRDQGAFV